MSSARLWTQDQYIKIRGPRMAKTTLKKKRIKIGRFTFPHFKTYFKAVIIKRARYRHKDKHTEPWKTSEIDSHVYGQLICNKGAKAIQRGKECCFQQMVPRQLDTYMQENKFGSLPPTIHKN